MDAGDSASDASDLDCKIDLDLITARSATDSDVANTQLSGSSSCSSFPLEEQGLLCPHNNEAISNHWMIQLLLIYFLSRSAE